MNTVILGLLFVAMVYGRSHQRFAKEDSVFRTEHKSTTPSTLISRTEVRDGAGQYALSYETKDGTIVNEQGKLKKIGKDGDEVLVKEGSFSYISPEGIPIQLTYVANEYGFNPEGRHLPTSVNEESRAVS